MPSEKPKPNQNQPTERKLKDIAALEEIGDRKTVAQSMRATAHSCDLGPFAQATDHLVKAIIC
jgi:hypothetical protein